MITALLNGFLCQPKTVPSTYWIHFGTLKEQNALVIAGQVLQTAIIDLKDM